MKFHALSMLQYNAMWLSLNSVEELRVRRVCNAWCDDVPAMMYVEIVVTFYFHIWKCTVQNMLTMREDVQVRSTWKSGVYHGIFFCIVWCCFQFEVDVDLTFVELFFIFRNSICTDVLLRNVQMYTKTSYHCSIFWRYVGRLKWALSWKGESSSVDIFCFLLSKKIEGFIIEHITKYIDWNDC